MSIPHKISPHCPCQSIFNLVETRPIEPFNNSSHVSPIILQKNIRLRKETYLTFLPDITNSIIREVISHFQMNIRNIVK